MKLLVLYLLGSITFLFFTSCEQKTKSSSSENTLQLTEKEKEYAFLEQKINEIDSLPENQTNVVRSLRWEKINNDVASSIEVAAVLDADGFPVKVVEYYAEGNMGKRGERKFYLEKEKIFAVAEIYDEWIDSSTVNIIEQRTFFENENPVYAKQRSADYEVYLKDKPWVKIRPENKDISRAYSILSREGDFQPHFLSYIQGDDMLFLLLGEPKEENRYVTTVQVEKMNDFIADLIKHKKEYKFRPMYIEFDIVGGKGTPEFRVLRKAEWID